MRYPIVMGTSAVHAERLTALRDLMRAHGIDLYVVRATDRFLNEYVPTGESTRVWLSGFTGSTGDALVSLDRAWMFVDGRYDLQATHELDASHWIVEKVALGTALERAIADRAVELSRARGAELKLGYEADRFSIELLQRFEGWTSEGKLALVASKQSLVELARGPIDESRGSVRAIDEGAVGRTVAEKIASVAKWLREQDAAAMVVQRLDELAYLTNLRGNELPYQATFRSAALVTATEVIVAVEPGKVSDAVRRARAGVAFVPESGFADAVKRLGAGAVVAIDAGGITVAMRELLTNAGARVRLAPSPLTAMKAKKTPEELVAMRSAFQRADRVVADAQKWLIERVVRDGARVTETDFAAQVERMFLASGAVGLSFRVISACGENAAVAHHPPDPSRVIARGEMMLLDTGAYYAEGYATDLTRTFFVGGEHDRPTSDMKRWFTLTLKAAIAGMTARIPRGANGAQLDGITRAPLWSEGLEYSHGTGHGVGINVHEFPPRVASVSLARLEEGHVFSIEPGVYLAGRGGVRIENLCTVVPDRDDPDFLRVESLTFSPLDARLIDDAILTSREREFLAWFAKGHVA